MKEFLLTTFELPACVTAEYYDSADMFTRESIWQLCYRDLSKHDVRIASEEELSELCFNTDTIFPERLRGMAERVLQDGKTNQIPEARRAYDSRCKNDFGVSIEGKNETRENIGTRLGLPF